MNYRDEFEKILEATKVNRMISQEEFNNRMQPMIQFIQRNVPAQLYKFRECTENNIEAFDKDEIWLSKASRFNDLHDSLLFLTNPQSCHRLNKYFRQKIFLLYSRTSSSHNLY